MSEQPKTKFKLGLELPIVNETYKVLYEDKPVMDALKDLMSRELTPEFESMSGLKAST